VKDLLYLVLLTLGGQRLAKSQMLTRFEVEKALPAVVAAGEGVVIRFLLRHLQELRLEGRGGADEDVAIDNTTELLLDTLTGIKVTLKFDRLIDYFSSTLS